MKLLSDLQRLVDDCRTEFTAVSAVHDLCVINVFKFELRDVI